MKYILRDDANENTERKIPWTMKPEREWYPVKQCACGECRFVEKEKCPAVTEENLGVTLWASESRELAV